MPTNSGRLEAIKARRYLAAKITAEKGWMAAEVPSWSEVDFLLDSLTRVSEEAFDEAAEIADDRAELLRKAIPDATGERQDVILRLRMSTAKGIADAIRAARDSKEK